MRYYALFIIGLGLLACNREVPSEFSELALKEIFVNEYGDEVKFGSILDSYKGRTIIIDVWASWCGDCIKNLPEVRALQEQYSEIVFLFLSVDKNQRNWKKGIEKYNIKGEHYYMQSGWSGDFGDFIDLDWTPRYIVVDKDQKIKLFEAVKANDKRIKEVLL
jgi:thiol-disulfide isomerase/thioredoxin